MIQWIPVVTWGLAQVFLAGTAGTDQVGDKTSGPGQGLPRVAPADLSTLRPADFSDEELDLPYYLAHLHRLANAVVEDGENRGFIDIAVWRTRRDNMPYNARIMENCLSLAYFYCTRRPWNSYYGDPALRRRLEAAMDFWCRIQDRNGRFSEYEPGRYGLAPTAFATKFMGEALVLLHEGPPLDPVLSKRVTEAVRKALVVTFTDAALYEHGRQYTNQYTNAFAGALAFLSLHPDQEIERLLRQKVEQADAAFQSPAGYFYERHGADWGYNLNTHHSNLLMAYRYSRAPLQRDFVQEEQRFIEWLSYNAVLEPNNSGYVLNRAIETRQKHPFLERLGAFAQQEAFLSEDVPAARAFVRSRREVQKERAERRRRLEVTWPDVEELRVGEFRAYSPYAFLNRSHRRVWPSDGERDAAVAALPYIRTDRFIHQRVDSRRSVQFTYVRRPGYYAVVNSGEILSPQQRYGLGLFWIPKAGTVLQSQTGSSNAAWGTRADTRQVVYEADSLQARWTLGGKPVTPQSGHRDLVDGTLTMFYPLGENGTKEVVFTESRITVTITHKAPFTECIPLLVGPEDRSEAKEGLFTLRKAGARVSIAMDPAVSPTLADTGDTVAGRRVVAVTFRGLGSLTYSIEVHTNP